VFEGRIGKPKGIGKPNREKMNLENGKVARLRIKLRRTEEGWIGKPEGIGKPAIEVNEFGKREGCPPSHKASADGGRLDC
jgi:hypothetical protein